DRLHNMRTLEHLDDEKQRRIALETREIYAPLAHRFGMAGVKAELEDLAFKLLERDDYRGLSRKVRAKKVERERTIERLRAPLGDALREASLADIEITGRPKNLWSIYKKMKKRDKPFEEIYDLLAVRVLVNSIPECYHVLGIIHHKWTPLQERIKDYIASPKSNGYQSLHTTVFGPGGQLYEIQIRTRDMHHTAEYGIAAHWLFKEGKRSADELDRHLAWFRQLIELQQDTHTPEEFLEFLKVDLYQAEIFVFTPAGVGQMGRACQRRRRGLEPPTEEQLRRAATTLSVATPEQLQAALGRGDVALGTMMRALYPDLPADELQLPKPTAFGRVIQRLR